MGLRQLRGGIVGLCFVDVGSVDAQRQPSVIVAAILDLRSFSFDRFQQPAFVLSVFRFAARGVGQFHRSHLGVISVADGVGFSGIRDRFRGEFAQIVACLGGGRAELRAAHPGTSRY